MQSIYIREQQRYSQENLRFLFSCSSEKIVLIIKRLKEFGILKAVSATSSQSNLSDLIEEYVVISDVEEGDAKHYYVFTFVGVISVSGYILKCFPKYIENDTPLIELKRIIKILEWFNSKEQIVFLHNSNEESSAFNLLAIMLYLLHDYYENGVYNKIENIIETNGTGEILWDKTINETFASISNNRPHYTSLFSRKRVVNEYDYFRKLHECVLSHFTNELRKADLLDLFDIMPVELTDDDIFDYGSDEYICYRIENELNVQFNTRQQLVLKAIYSYISNKHHIDSQDSFSLFGTNCFNRVWERVCAEVIGNQLYDTLGSLQLPVPLSDEYRPTDTLISL